MLSTMFKKSFPIQLEKAMHYIGISQRELARRINISNSTVSRNLQEKTLTI